MNYYYLGPNNEVIGPVTGSELYQLLATGSLLPTSMVCEEGSNEWSELRSVITHIAESPLKQSESKNLNLVFEKPNCVDQMNASNKSIVLYIQGAAIIVLLIIGLIFQANAVIKRPIRWEYKSVTFFVEKSSERQGKDAFKYSSIKLDDRILCNMGQQGWEALGCYLEMETAFPNFGQDDYVTGIRENIRPQSLVVIFKRAVR